MQVFLYYKDWILCKLVPLFLNSIVLKIGLNQLIQSAGPEIDIIGEHNRHCAEVWRQEAGT